MNEHDHDDPKISALYRQLPPEEPSPDTDALISAAARRAVGAGPRRRLSLPLLQRLTATAAALLLGVGLTLQWQHRQVQEFRDTIAVVATPQAPVPAPALPAASPSRPAAEQESGATPALRRQRSAAAPRHAETYTEAEAGVTVSPSAPEAAPSAPLAAAPAADAPEPPPQQTAARDEAESIAARKRLFAAGRAASQARESAAHSARAQARQEAAPPVPAPTGDYRLLMAGGDYAAALAAAQAVDSAAARVDRDLLQQLLGHNGEPACAHLPASSLGQDLPLCELLQLQSQARPLPADWRARLDDAGVVIGDSAYRQQAVERVFSRP